MRVLFQSRRDLLDAPGGDTHIALELREALRRRGIDVTVDCGPEPDLRGFDAVHLFNVAHRDCHAQARNAYRRGRALVVSTIYWNQDALLPTGSRERSDYRERWRTRIRRPLWRLAERVGLPSEETARRRRLRSEYYALGAHGMARAVVALADLLLPGSPREVEELLRDFPEAADTPMQVVPHGIDPSAFAPAKAGRESRFWRAHRRRGFLLCVGRVERRKNQLALLEAARGLDLPVVLVGAAGDASYAARVRERLRRHDLWLPHWPHASMPEVFALARLHALPSFNETPGLASLEAAAMGVPVVVGSGGAERDYFGPHADYCDPRDPPDIRRACLAALARPRPALELAAHVRGRFTWERSAERVLEGYAQLSRPRRDRIGEPAEEVRSRRA